MISDTVNVKEVSKSCVTVLLCPFKSSRETDEIWRKLDEECVCVYPDHEHGLPDVPHAVVHQTGRVDELVLVHWLRIGAQSLHCCFHLLGETWHHCTQNQKRSFNMMLKTLHK